MAELNSILHVDDDADILEITRMALQIVDSFELHQFNSGQAALDALGNLQPDLLLLDFMMPGMTGPDFWDAAKTKSGRSDIPTIFMTAKAEDEISEELLNRGALAVITKPFDPMSLGKQIRAAWSRVKA